MSLPVPPPSTLLVEKQMTLSTGEFAKSMAAFAGDDVVINDGRATVAVDGAGVAVITYEPLPPRRVGGLLDLPQAKVTITLSGVAPAASDAFLKRFDIAFQRGGG